LLDKIESLFVREEETVNSLTKFCLVLAWRKAVKPQYIDKINEGLVTLRDDTDRHMRILTELKEQVKAERENGF